MTGTETKNHPNTELLELGLSDEMIELHPSFRCFPVDMEIFVNHIADMRIHGMNTVLEATRRTILENNHGNVLSSLS